jgi:transcription initiation factor IIF auxiliary subunit
MTTAQEILNSLAHHGVKGMKWGVRKDGSVSSTTTRTSSVRRPAQDITAKQKPGQFVRTTGGKRNTAAEDAVKVAAARQLAKKSTTDALTTKQLQEAVTRMNLEQQYTQLAKKQDRRTRGQRFIQALLGSGKADNQNTATAQTARQVAAALAKKAAAGAA